MQSDPPSAAPLRQKILTLLGTGLLAAFYLFIGCPLHVLTGISCPGCGMTRALRALLRLDFSGALQYHPLIIVLPLLAVWALLGLLKRRLPKKTENIPTALTPALFLIVSAIRLINGDPVVKPDFSSSVLHKIISCWRGMS